MPQIFLESQSLHICTQIETARWFWYKCLYVCSVILLFRDPTQYWEWTKLSGVLEDHFQHHTDTGHWNRNIKQCSINPQLLPSVASGYFLSWSLGNSFAIFYEIFSVLWLFRSFTHLWCSFILLLTCFFILVF